MEFKIEVSDEKLAKELECREHNIIEGILTILRSYNIEKAENEDFRCVEEIITLLEDNGYNASPCHDFQKITAILLFIWLRFFEKKY